GRVGARPDLEHQRGHAGIADLLRIGHVGAPHIGPVQRMIADIVDHTDDRRRDAGIEVNHFTDGVPAAEVEPLCRHVDDGDTRLPAGTARVQIASAEQRPADRVHVAGTHEVERQDTVVARSASEAGYCDERRRLVAAEEPVHRVRHRLHTGNAGDAGRELVRQREERRTVDAGPRRSSSATSRWSRSRPMLCVSIRWSPCASRAVPVSSTSDSATCSGTSSRPMGMRPPPRVPPTVLPNERIGDATFDRDARNAGTRPKHNVAPTLMTSVKASTGQLTRATPDAPPAVAAATSARLPHPAAAKPTAAPNAPTTALSVIIWRTNRRRPAPNAMRRLISGPRAAARASTRFARFVHTISR